MNLNQWAIKWGVPYVALHDLRVSMGEIHPTIDVIKGKSETAISSQTRYAATLRGELLMRNNSGAYQPASGGFVRYGLGNDSKKTNKIFKSSDLIGIKSVIITSEMIGYTLGVFVAREVKKWNWHYSGTLEEIAQYNFIRKVNSMGGDACFTNRVGSV